MCPSMPASSSARFPSDGFVTDGLSVHGAEAYSGVVAAADDLGRDDQLHHRSGPCRLDDRQQHGRIRVSFGRPASAVLLAWGGHLAQSRFWNLAAGGVRDGAGEVSGAPWHMRTLQLDGSGNKNQDRSIQPSAIVGELPPSPSRR